jgi:hypothetical protein
MYSTIPIHWNIQSAPPAQAEVMLGQLSTYLASWSVPTPANPNPDLVSKHPPPFPQSLSLPHSSADPQRKNVLNFEHFGVIFSGNLMKMRQNF